MTAFGSTTSRPSGGATDASARWVAGLSAGHPARDAHLRELHGLLVRAAHHELRRRPAARDLGDGEREDLAHQAADDALVAVTGKLAEFRGASRFTTWAYKFAVFEVSNQLARRIVRARYAAAEMPDWERFVDTATVAPDARVEQRELLAALRSALGRLTDRQRAVFVAVALNEEPIDVVALRLGSNRGAIYKTLFDARQRLRTELAAAGHDLSPR